MQIVILGLSTVVAHLLRFEINIIATKLNIMSFELEEGEIAPYFEPGTWPGVGLGPHPAIGGCGPL